MSWSVNATGTITEVKESLKRQFEYPLAEPPSGLSDEGERRTVSLVRDMIDQCLGTFGAEKSVRVSAYGHIGFDSWENKTGAFQEVNLTIAPSA